MEDGLDTGMIQVPLVEGEVSVQIVDGQVYGNTIQVTDGAGNIITLDPNQHSYTTDPNQQHSYTTDPNQHSYTTDPNQHSYVTPNHQSYNVNSNQHSYSADVNQHSYSVDPNQHSYSAPLPAAQYIIQDTSHQVVLQNPIGTSSGHVVVPQPELEDDVEINIKTEDVTSHLMSADTITPSLSHHDYIASMPPILKTSIDNHGHGSIVAGSVNEQDTGLVIEEAVEQEIVSSQTLEDEEIVRSKPLTAMYLQRKEVGISDTVFIPTHHQTRITSPSKSPGSSKFTLRPSSRTLDLGYGDDLGSVDDLGRMRLSYNDPISVYHPNTGEIHFKVEEFEAETKKSHTSPQRSVGAILAASEAIKHQDIASEVEIGVCEVEISEPKKGRKRKEKERKGGIDDDIEQIRKAAKNVAFTLKGMKEAKDGRKKKKPRIRLTLTKSRNRRLTPTYPEEDMEYETSSVKSKRGRKRKGEYSPKNEVSNIIYQCEYCEMQFKTREKVRTHTKIHTEERGFSCDECGAAFRRREHLVRHYRRHTNERPYQCLECGKTYMRAEHLKRHSFDHSGEKPFGCPVCPRAFTRHDRLIKHSLVHDK